jgi:glycyl-tRNA synthetase
MGVECREGLSAEELNRLVEEKGIRCPECGGILQGSEPFNLMFQVKIGSYGNSILGYGRPEAAQGQFLDFKRVYTSERERLPLGIAQIGRCVRNEIAPRKGPIRLREFTIIDYEVFVDPENLSYPRISLVKGQKLRILTVEEQCSRGEKAVELTVQEALDLKLVKNEVLCYFMALATQFIQGLGVPYEKQRFREVPPEERAHYSAQTFDQEVWLERWGWTEVAGHAYRTDYDLRNHMAHSNVDLRVRRQLPKPRRVKRFKVTPLVEELTADFGVEDTKTISSLIKRSDPEIVVRELREKGFYEVTGRTPRRIGPRHVEVKEMEVEEKSRSFIPHVVEPSFGVDRIIYAMLEYGYREREGRIVLEIPKDVAGIKAGVFPLVNRDGLPELARHLADTLIDEGLIVTYDESGSIGRRYARADEIGIPICITVDYQTLQDKTVTLRDLYSWAQVRVSIRDLPSLLHDYLKGTLEFNQLGVSVTRGNQDL